MVKRWLAVSGLAVCCFLVAGCPATFESWIKITLNSEIVESIYASHGESLTFESLESGVSDVTWVLEEGQYRGEFSGRLYTNTFVNTTGSPVTYKLTVFGSSFDGRVVSASVWITVTSAGASPVLRPITFDIQNLIITGGVRQADGSIRVTLGGALTLDCSGAFQGGVAPFDIYWIDNGVIIGRGLTCQISSGQAGQRNIILRIIDSRGVTVEYIIVIVVIVVEDPPTANLTIDLKVDGKDGPFEVARGTQLKISWTSSNAKRVDVFTTPWSSKFDGERALNTIEDELATFPPGVWTLQAVAKNTAGVTKSDSVQVTVIDDTQPGQLCITDVTHSGGPFRVGQQVTVTVHHTGVGVIHHLMATSTVVGSVTPSASGVTTFTYRWPFTTGSGAESFIWPDDRDAPPDIFVIPTVVVNP